MLTTAGTAAAIDACLHLVHAEHGANIANALARRMVVAPHRPGGPARFVRSPVAAEPEDDRLVQLMEWAQQHLTEPLSVADLAA